MAKLNLLRDYTTVSSSEWLSVIEYYKRHTSSETAARFGIKNTHSFVTALARDHTKGAGHGGARAGAGNRNQEGRAVTDLQKAILEAQAISGLHTLPDPNDITADNAEKKAIETANVLRGTIAALKEIITKITALAVGGGIFYFLFF